MSHHSYREEIELAGKLKTSRAREDYEKLLIGSTIQKLRKKAKISQKEMASYLKTTQSAIARMEAGKQNFTIQTLLKISFFFKKRLYIKLL